MRCLLMWNAISTFPDPVCSTFTALIGFMHLFLTSYLPTKMTVRKANQPCIYHIHIPCALIPIQNVHFFLSVCNPSIIFSQSKRH